MKNLLSISILVALNGCGSTYVHVSAPFAVHPFKGVSHSVKQTGRAWQKPFLPGETLVWASDVPLSLALDLLLLPYDVLMVTTKPKDSVQTPLVVLDE